MEKNSYFNVRLLLLLIVLEVPFYLTAQTQIKHRVMFYNVENLFDTLDDTLKNDSEYLPGAARYWSDKRMYAKLNRIYKVVVALGEWEPPLVVGLCEVENQNVLERLLAFTPLGRMGYKIVHKESPDSRGIDVALLYRSDIFQPISYYAIPVVDSLDPGYQTRDILHVKGVAHADTLHFLVNHWPSKYGGLLESEPRRFLAANTVKNYVDSLMAINENAKVILMGDFNDSPTDRSVLEILKASTIGTQPDSSRVLYNLAYSLSKQGRGSHKFQEKWDLIDQMIVSTPLLFPKTKGGCYTKPGEFRIFDADFLLEKDKTHLGKKPFRTYVGFKYNDGFSDHLPVYLNLYWDMN